MEITQRLHVIDCEAHTDDLRIMVDFDACSWFEKASDNDILELREIGFGTEQKAMSVVESFAETNEDVKGMLDYLSLEPRLSNGTIIGFDCHIDEHDAETWISKKRPHIALTPVT